MELSLSAALQICFLSNCRDISFYNNKNKYHKKGFFIFYDLLTYYRRLLIGWRRHRRGCDNRNGQEQDSSVHSWLFECDATSRGFRKFCVDSGGC
jgi:hypothetical protein